MKKILMGFVALLTLFLAACSNNTQAPSESSTAEGTKEEIKLSIAGPKGAPSLGLSELLTNHEEEYTYNIGLQPNALGPLFMKSEFDIIVAPVNMGAMQYTKNNAGYVLTSVITWGNLYIASQRPSFKLEDINDNEFTYFGANSVNEVIVNYLLEENNLVPSAKRALGDASLTKDLLLSDANAIVVTAEPALTAAKIANPNIISYSIQELYKNASGHNGFPQGGVFVKKDTISKHKDSVDKFLTELKASVEFSKTSTKEAAGFAENLGLGKAGPLTKAMPNCNISYKTAKDSKAEIEYLVSLDATKFGGAKPNDAFYYEG